MAETKAVTRAGSLPASPVDPAQALTASKALLAYIRKAAQDEAAKSGKRSLLAAAAGDDDDDDDAGAAAEDGVPVAETPIWLTVSTKRHILDAPRLQPHKIAVPHPLHGADGGATGGSASSSDDDTTICLITADPQRAYKNLVASADFPADLRQRITRVVDVAHLAKKFRAYEAQRKLFAEHDVFLGDERIINRLPKALGKTFYKTTVKRPIPVVLAKTRPRGADGKRVKPAKKARRRAAAGGNDDDDDGAADEAAAAAVEEATANARAPAQIAAEIRKAIGAAVVHLGPTASTAVKVGRAGWPAEHVAANVEAVCRELVGKYVPQRWTNVKSIFIKGPRTMSLPVWQTDELWLEAGADVLKSGSAELAAFEAKMAAKREKANVGKKRKALAEGEDSKEAPAAKKEKKDRGKGKVAAATAAAESKEGRPSKKAKAAVPESNDGGLDKQIAAHKEKLKKQKNKAKKAVDV